MNKLVIALSGEICSKDSSSLEGFWKGFINIQRSISNIDELKIVAHNMDQQFDNLVTNVYGIDLLSSQSLENKKPTKNTFNIDFANVSSKRKSLMLIENLNVDSNTWVLSTRWVADKQNIEPITFDNSLPKSYLYLAYHANVDECYSTSWCYGSYEQLKYLSEYEVYLRDIITGETPFIEKYSHAPWPLAIKKNTDKWSSLKRMFFISIDEKINFQLFSKFIPILSRRIDGLEYRLKKALEKPIVTGENSLLHSSDSNVLLSDFGEVIKEGSFFKSFALESGLRDKIRFLADNDFERVSEGQVINPIGFACVIYTHSRFSSCWEKILQQATKYLPVNCFNVYLISECSVKTDEAFAKLKKKDVKLNTFNEGKSLSQELNNIFIKINNEVEYIYFIPDNTPLISGVDAIYLNSLLHFLGSTKETYVQLTGRNFINGWGEKEPFPFIVKQAHNCPLFTQPAIIKIKDFVCNNWHTSDTEGILTVPNISFSVVFDALNSDKYNGGNHFFPHAHVNISLDEDVMTEWEKDIEFETSKYEKIEIQVG